MRMLADVKNNNIHRQVDVKLNELAKDFASGPSAASAAASAVCTVHVVKVERLAALYEYIVRYMDSHQSWVADTR